MRFGTLFSGIGAPEVAWSELGWNARWCAETSAFPSAVLSARWPEVWNLGDVREIDGRDLESVDVVVGGTPCQSFSLAGSRGGMDDARGQLAFDFFRVAADVRARWVVWENVPGVLSQDGGRAFDAITAYVAQRGYGWAYRILDARYFGVPQRRRRVFLVGRLGDWRGAAAVLFERASLQGDLASGGEAEAAVAGTLEVRAGTGGHDPGAHGAATGHIVMQCHGNNVGPMGVLRGGSGAGSGVAFMEVASALTVREYGDGAGEESKLVGAISTGDRGISVDPACAGMVLGDGVGVRRLTPVEYERLQGFPDDYTRVPYRGKPAEECPDRPRYKAVGNSMAVPVVEWLGGRIEAVDGVMGEGKGRMGRMGRMEGDGEGRVAGCR